MSGLRPALVGGFVAALMAMAGVASCGRQESDEAPTHAGAPKGVAAPSAEATPALGMEAQTPAGPEVVVAGPEDVHAAIASRRGQVVLVDFWATWCPPCVEEFPKVLEWRKEFGPQGLAILLVSMDDPSDPAVVREFLRERSSPLGSLLLDVPEYDVFVRAFGGEWGGGIPALFLYGRDGTLVHSFTLGEGAATIRAAIESAVDGQR